jgi:Ca-activated chloride channel family protein
VRLPFLVILLAAICGAMPARAEDPPASVKITSPLGRSGLPGKVRIVARVTLPRNTAPPPVRFYVDDALLATDTDGPPYAVEWEDENPFAPRRVGVEFDDAFVGLVRDEIELQPFEFFEVAHVLSVRVDAAVQDSRGRVVGGLTASDFQLFEDGAPQPIDSVSAERVATTFALVVDTSHSMSRNIDFVRIAAARLSAYLAESDSVIVAPFKNGITSVTGPTRDTATVADAVASVKAEGGTAILDALKEVTGHFADGPGRRVVVLITDGYDEHSLDSPDEVLNLLKTSGVTVHVIAVGGVSGVSLAGERLLRRIAHETGGRAFFPWNQKELTQAHATIAEETQHLYQIAYTPTNQRQDGTWRAITVTAALPDSRVRARRGYQAPAPPPVRASLEFTVTDAARRHVDLTLEDLEIFEDGVTQQADVFHEAVAPVSIVLALDASGSMTRSAQAVQDAASTFIRSSRPDDPMGVILFADKAEVVSDLTTNRDAAGKAVQAYTASGGTALYDALADALDLLKPVNGRRVIVVVTDGRDENAQSTGPGSIRSWDAVMAQATAVDATVYAIGLGSRVDRARLEQLAALTGGEAYFTSDVEELEHHYRRIGEELRRRYVLAYTSTHPARDGGWRKVEIRFRQAGLNVRSREGYTAPAQ